MSGTSNPIDAAIVDGTPVSKSGFRSYEKTYVRKTIADANAVVSGDWSGQIAGLHLLSNGADYNLNTSDTTTAPDGDNYIRDANNLLFVKQVPVRAPVAKLVTAGGDVTIDDAETADEIEINNTSGGPISVYLPSVSVRTKSITVTDVGGNAGTTAITVRPKASSGQTVMTGATYVLDVNGMGIKLTPNSAKTGYK